MHGERGRVLGELRVGVSSRRTERGGVQRSDKVRETCVELAHEAFRGTREGQTGFPFTEIDLTRLVWVQITTYRR